MHLIIQEKGHGLIDLDEMDGKILRLLQADAGVSTADIAAKVGLSTSPCWRRIKKLEEQGVIRRRVALADMKAVGLNLTAFVAVKTAHHTESWLNDFAASIARIPEVVEVYRMSGEIDYLLKVVCPDMAEFDRIYKRLISIADFSDVRSTFSMEELKYTTELPLDYA